MASESLSEGLNSKFFWGSMPPNPLEGCAWALPTAVVAMQLQTPVTAEDPLNVFYFILRNSIFSL